MNVNLLKVKMNHAPIHLILDSNQFTGCIKNGLFGFLDTGFNLVIWFVSVTE